MLTEETYRLDVSEDVARRNLVSDSLFPLGEGTLQREPTRSHANNAHSENAIKNVAIRRGTQSERPNNLQVL